MPYQVATPKFSNQPNFYHQDHQATVTWVAQPEYGTHATNIAAKRAYLVMMGIAEKDGSDDYIRQHWRFCVNTGTAKIIKVADTPLKQAPKRSL